MSSPRPPESPHGEIAERLRVHLAYDDDVDGASDALLAVLRTARLTSESPALEPTDGGADEAA